MSTPPKFLYRVTHPKATLDHYDPRKPQYRPDQSTTHAGPPPSIKGNISRKKRDERTQQVATLILAYEEAVDRGDPVGILEILEKMDDQGFTDLARVKRRDCPIALPKKETK